LNAERWLRHVDLHSRVFRRPAVPVDHPLCGTVELLRQYLDKQNGPIPDNICLRSSRQRFRNDRIDEVEHAKNRTKAKVRSKVEHLLAVVKPKFGFMRVRYRGSRRTQTVCLRPASAEMGQFETEEMGITGGDGGAPVSDQWSQLTPGLKASPPNSVYAPNPSWCKVFGAC
jgi:hypothetical protein